MELNKQNQTAGDNAHQSQIENVNQITVLQGITEERAREIFQEMNRQAMANYTQDAYTEAIRRVRILEKLVMDRTEKVDGMLDAFRDPAFQILLAEAQKRAAATEREADYELLSELLVCHVQKGKNKINRAGINRAVEIVGDIDTSALCALTVAYSAEAFVPASGNITKGLSALNDLFEKVMYDDLPAGNEWIDHLELLGAVRISAFGSMGKIHEHYAKKLNGYTCAGIKKDSDDYERTVSILNEANVDTKIVVNHELLDGYVRLSIMSEEQIDDLTYESKANRVPISKEEKQALKQICSMYVKDIGIIEAVNRAFAEQWSMFPAWVKLSEWWDGLKQPFRVTQLGRILAYTNAKRCEPHLPDFID